MSELYTPFPPRSASHIQIPIPIPIPIIYMINSISWVPQLPIELGPLYINKIASSYFDAHSMT